MLRRNLRVSLGSWNLEPPVWNLEYYALRIKLYLHVLCVCCRFTITAGGALQIRDVQGEDGYTRFMCQAMHKLSGERRVSMPGQLVVTGQFELIPFSSSNTARPFRPLLSQIEI